MTAEIAHVTIPKVGEKANGDAVYVRRETHLLFAVIDGLGHGPDAAQASAAAVVGLEGFPLERSVREAMTVIHDALKGTRGAAATVCIVRDHKLEACAVGNVQLASTQSSVPLVLSAGILGHRVVNFRVCECVLSPGARVALMSDGISSGIRLEAFRQMNPEETCRAIMRGYRRHDDDATVLVADMDR